METKQILSISSDPKPRKKVVDKTIIEPEEIKILSKP
jgi:hypothetical protein